MCPNHHHYIEYHCRCVQYIYGAHIHKKKCCTFDDAVKLKYINLNDIIQFDDFMMHIKREIDSYFFYFVFCILFYSRRSKYFTIDQFSRYKHSILAYIGIYKNSNNNNLAKYTLHKRINDCTQAIWIIDKIPHIRN